MGKSCSAKSCILAAAASLKKAQAGGLKEEMVRAHIRLKSSAPINPMRPHKIFAGAPASGLQGRRREAGQGEARGGRHELTRSNQRRGDEILSSRSRGRLRSCPLLTPDFTLNYEIRADDQSAEGALTHSCHVA